MINAGVLNSVVFLSTGVATLNVTPPVDAAYDHIVILYKKNGGSIWIVGDSYIGSQGVAGTVTQSGLTDTVWYHFCVVASDSSGRLSLPSNTVIAKDDEFVPEEIAFVENGIILLSNCPTFQSLTGSLTAEAARTRIFDMHFDEVSDEKKFPMAVLYYNGVVAMEKIAETLFIGSCELVLTFIDTAPKQRDRIDRVVARAFMTRFGKIAQEMRSLQGTDTFLNCNSIDAASEPYFGGVEDDKEETEDLIFVDYKMQCGFK